MLFNSGNRALLATARLYANDPSGAANPRFADQQWKDLINTEYLFLREIARIPNVGWTRKRAYADGVATDSPDDMFYELPADFVGRLRVEVSTNGSDLSTTLPGSDPSILVLTPIGHDIALDHYNVNSGGTSDIRYCFIHDQHFGISTPLTAAEAGTNSIRITYEASAAELSGDTDEPDLPRPHQDVIAMGAAVRANAADNIDNISLERRYEMGKSAFVRSAWTHQVDDPTGQIIVSGRRPPSRVSNVGRMRKR